MTERRRVTSSLRAAKLAFAGMLVAGGALALAAQAGADPVEPLPLPGDGAPTPGQPMAAPGDPAAAAPAPPPGGPPLVPEIADPHYGSGSGSGGTLGSIRDLYHEARGGDLTGTDPAEAQGNLAPPPGAGPAPKLPPGFTSLTDPSSSTPALPKDPNATGPALPPGYYPLNGAPPPGYAAPATPADPAAPPAAAPIVPTP